MKIDFQTVESVVAAIRTCSDAVSKKQGPEADIRLDVKDGYLVVTSADTPNRQLQVRVPGNVMAEGSCVAVVKDLRDRLSGLDSNHLMTLEVSNGRILITTRRDLSSNKTNTIESPLSTYLPEAFMVTDHPEVPICSFDNGDSFVRWLSRLTSMVGDSTVFKLALSGRKLTGYHRDSEESINLSQDVLASESWEDDFVLHVSPDAIKQLPNLSEENTVLLSTNEALTQLGFRWETGTFWCTLSTEELDESRIIFGLDLPPAAQLVLSKTELQAALRLHTVSGSMGTQMEVSSRNSLVLNEVGLTALRCKAEVSIEGDADLRWRACTDNPTKLQRIVGSYFKTAESLVFEQVVSPYDEESICLRFYDPSNQAGGFLWTTTLAY